jgi:hypothetical protein
LQTSRTHLLRPPSKARNPRFDASQACARKLGVFLQKQPTIDSASQKFINLLKAPTSSAVRLNFNVNVSHYPPGSETGLRNKTLRLNVEQRIPP